MHQAKATVEVEEHRYPFTGAENARVKLGMVRATDSAVRWLDLPAEDGYIARVDWHPDGRLLVQWLARNWQRLELRAYDHSGAASTLLIEELQPWINLHHDLRAVEATGEFTWSSERSGFRHLYLYAPDGTLVRQLTSGNWPAEATVALDENGRQVYFVGWQERPLDRQLFRVSLNGGDDEPLTRGSGMTGAVIAPDFSSYVSTSDYLIEPPNINVVSLRDQKVTRVIHSPSEVAVDYPPPELHSFRTSDGVELFAAIYRPSQDFPPPRAGEGDFSGAGGK